MWFSNQIYGAQETVEKFSTNLISTILYQNVKLPKTAREIEMKKLQIIENTNATKIEYV